MFSALTKRLNSAFEKMRGRGVLSENDVQEVLREVRIALLEGDVALPVVKELIAGVKEKATGQSVLRSVQPAQQVIKLVHDHLVDVLGRETASLNLSTTPPAVIMMVGLQGSGKTTSTAKLASFLTQQERKKVLMASLDIYRPAAQEQLQILAQSHQLAVVPIVPGEAPLEITRRALEIARLEGYDVLLLDTAGRLHIDTDLMQELQQVKSLAQPIELLLVADAMAGQDAVNVAKTFHESVGVTGIILTRVDGDARGGAALSMRHITGCPIKFMGTGEQIDRLEVFHPQRIAGRILDMGDVVTLVEQAMDKIDHDEAQRAAQKMQAGTFDLDDMRKQLQQMTKMGGLSHMLSMMPGFKGMQDKMGGMSMDEKILTRQIAIIQSMTRQERRNDKILNASRRVRIASGAGVTVQDVNRLIKQFKGMQQVMKKFKQLGAGGMLRRGIKGLF